MPESSIAAQAAQAANGVLLSWVLAVGGIFTLFLLGLVRQAIFKRDAEITSILLKISADIEQVKNDLSAHKLLIAGEYLNSDGVEASQKSLYEKMSIKFDALESSIKLSNRN